MQFVIRDVAIMVVQPSLMPVILADPPSSGTLFISVSPKSRDPKHGGALNSVSGNGRQLVQQRDTCESVS